MNDDKIQFVTDKLATVFAKSGNCDVDMEYTDASMIGGPKTLLFYCKKCPRHGVYISVTPAIDDK